MTQSKLAECLDYANERQLQRIECGETGCSVDKLMELAQILGVSTDYLLFGIENELPGIYEDVLRDKSERQKLYLLRVLRAAADNIGMLV